MAETRVKTVLFITGVFLGNNCWDDWRQYFESKGYKTLAPSWPHKDAAPEELRGRFPDPSLASNRLTDLKAHFATIARQLPQQPILIGHSLGGLIVQLLLQDGIGAAGIAIHSFPIPGASTFDISFLTKWWRAMGIFSPAREPYLLPLHWWSHNITNGLNSHQQQITYFLHAIPESKLLVRELFTSRIPFDYTKPHPPLLLTSGSEDRIIPPHINYRNFKKYKAGGSIVEYKEFSWRPHFVFEPSIWIEEADFILYWLHRRSPIFHPL